MKSTYLLPFLIFTLSFVCNTDLIGQTKKTTNKVQVKSKTPVKTKSTVKSKPAKKGIKSKPLKYMGKEVKNAVKDVKKEL